MMKNFRTWLVAAFAALVVAVPAMGAGIVAGGSGVVEKLYVPAGSGAKPTTTQDALRRFVSGNEYATNADYAAARDALQISVDHQMQTARGTVQRLLSEVTQDAGSLMNYIPANLHAGIRAGSNTTDTCQYVQAAFNAGIKKIYVPAGTYLCASTVEIPAGGAIIGDGESTVFLRKVGATPVDFFRITATNSITLANFKIDGVAVLDAAEPTNRWSGIRIWSNGGEEPHDVTISGVTINYTTSGENQAEGTRGAITVDSAYSVYISKLKAYGNRATVVYLWGTARQVYIDQPMITGDMTAGTKIGSGISGQHTGDVWVSGGYVKSCAYSNISMNGPRSYVVGVTSSGSTLSGIVIGHGDNASQADDSVVMGNVTRDNTLEGITISNSSNVRVFGNYVTNNGGGTRYGIRLLHEASYTGNKKNIEIFGNVVSGNSSAGIVAEYGMYVSIKYNRIASNASNGIYIENKKNEAMIVTIQGNDLIDNGGLVGAIESNAASGKTQTVYALNNTLISTDINTYQRVGIISSQATSTVYVSGNVFSTNYGTTNGVNFTFASRAGKPLNSFTSGVLQNANVLNAS